MAKQSLRDDVQPFNTLLRMAGNAQRDAKSFQERGDFESAFIEFARAAIIVNEIIPSDPDYRVLTSTQRHNMDLYGQEILDSLAEIKVPLVQHYEQWRENTSSAQLQSVPPQQAELAKREVEVTKREIAAECAEQEARRKEREVRQKEAELLLKEEDVRRKEQEALRIQERARRMEPVMRWREEQSLECEKGRRASEDWTGTNDVDVSGLEKLEGQIGRDTQVNNLEQNTAIPVGDQKVLRSVSHATSECETLSDTFSDYTVRSVNSYKERLQYFRH